LTPDGRRLGTDQGVRLWDVPNRRQPFHEKVPAPRAEEAVEIDPQK
jgi:hypothetical protein